jgi:hypothetical protein
MKQDSNKNKFDVNLSKEQLSKLQKIFGINKGRKFGDIKSNNDEVNSCSKVKRFFGK